MFNFFRKKNPSKTDNVDNARNEPSEVNIPTNAVAYRPPDCIEREGKDVVNLLLPDTDYSTKNNLTTILQNIMAGKKRRNKKKVQRTQSYCENDKDIPVLQRSVSDLEKHDVDSPTEAINTTEADFIKALVLQKYANKTNGEERHVSRVFVTNEPHEDEKRHAETLLRQIAKSIDCTIDDINHNQMGAADSKNENTYETVDNDSINDLKEDLKGELNKLLNEEEVVNNERLQEEKEIEDDKPKKSNLKPPKSDTEGCSDDERSESSKKRVTFRKYILFDDGDEQTDQETDSSFESVEEEVSSCESEDSVPDNDELLGGVVVSRTDIQNENVELKISNDNSDSGFIEISEVDSFEDASHGVVSEDESESVTESDTDEEAEDIVIEDVTNVLECEDFEEKTLLNQETKFQSQVAALSELADGRCGDLEKARDQINQYRKDIEEKDLEIERLKSELALAYKESELVRQRSRSLEEELTAARTCSANLADELGSKNVSEETIEELRSQLEQAVLRSSQLEAKVIALERDRDRLEEDKRLQEEKALEALTAAEASATKWRLAHESARSQASARAERMLSDCEWKMREIEKRARDAERTVNELTQELKTRPQSNPNDLAELQQLRGVVTEQQHSVQSLTLQLQRVETREEALKLEIYRLKDLLEKNNEIAKDKEDRHLQTIDRLNSEHKTALESLRTSLTQSMLASRKAQERTLLERSKNALAQLREEKEKENKGTERRLREITQRYEALKEELANKESEYERAVCEAHSRADWELLNLRHLLDKADITYANSCERANEKFEKEKESLIEEWSARLAEVEEKASKAETEAKTLLEATRSKLIAERNDMLNKLKEQHRNEMDDQWERFMSDKESCLARMKAECRQEGEEERVKREKELLDEISELRSRIHAKSGDFDNLVVKAATCSRSLAVTEQELREALEREKMLREKNSEQTTKLKKAEQKTKDQIDHLNRKCACLRKLFDDIRAKLAARERAAELDSKAKDKEIVHLKSEVARLTKLLMEQSSPTLEARTRADGCENVHMSAESFFTQAEPPVSDAQPIAPRRKGGTRIPEYTRKSTLPNLPSLPDEAKPNYSDDSDSLRRWKSVELPAVQVPERIRQLQEKTQQ